MTEEKSKKSDKPLDKMTVKELREIAKEITDLTGVHAMKKEDLLAAIKADQGADDAVEAPATKEVETKSAPKAPAAAKKKGSAKKEKPQLTVKEMKGQIRVLKAKRQQALSDKDSKMATIYRRQISRLKKKTRQAA